MEYNCERSFKSKHDHFLCRLAISCGFASFGGLQRVMEERTPEELEWYMERFAVLIQKCQDEHQLSLKFPKETTVRVEKGRVYWKIFVDSHDEWSGPKSLIFGFVRRKDGAILRAANMKAPETRTKNPVRGYIWDEDAGDTFSWTGVNYDLAT